MSTSTGTGTGTGTKAASVAQALESRALELLEMAQKAGATEAEVYGYG
ncbi:MAG: hypothetical protein ACI8WY_003791, partial [Planctomycetota bacterium]